MSADVSRETSTVDLPPGSLLQGRIGHRMVTILRMPTSWWDVRPQPPRPLWVEGQPEIKLRDVTVLWVPPQPMEGAT